MRLLQEADRVVMVQPYLTGVDGEFSHAVRKGPLLQRGAGLVEGLYAAETIQACEPTAAQQALAEQVLDALPFARSGLLYARVDLVPGPEGAPVVLELELTERSLFLATAPGAAERLADAIARRLIGLSRRR